MGTTQVSPDHRERHSLLDELTSAPQDSQPVAISIGLQPQAWRSRRQLGRNRLGSVGGAEVSSSRRECLSRWSGETWVGTHSV